MLARQIGVFPISGNNKLPSNTVNRIFHDKEGYIWLGTADGLCRYDAYRVVTFKMTDFGGAVPGANNVNVITEVNNVLLVGTEAGLFTIDKRSYRVSKFPDRRLRDSKINTILVDRQSQVWISAGATLYLYGPDLKLKHDFRRDATGGISIPATAVSSIYEDHSGNTWFCFWNKGLFRYDKNKRSFIAYPAVGANNNPFKIFQDKQGQYWICSWGSGLYLFDPEKKGPGMYREIMLTSKRHRGEKEKLFFDITQDDRFGFVWVVSFSGITAFRYTAAGTVEEVEFPGLFANVNNIFNDLYKDRDGVFWIGTFGEGAFTVNFTKPEIQNFQFTSIKDRYKIAPDFMMLYEDSDGLIWCNLNRLGLGFFDQHKKTVQLYSEFPHLTDIAAIRSVSCAVEIPGTKDVWIGSTNLPVISVFRKRGQQIVREEEIRLTDAAPSAGFPVYLFKDPGSNIWIGTNNGLFVKPWGEKLPRHVNAVPGYITGITCDQYGSIWVSTRGKGIHQLSITGSQVKLVARLDGSVNGPGINDVEALAADDDGNLWIGTINGRVIAYNITQKRFHDAIAADVLPRSPVLDILTDNNHVWITTARELFKLDRRTGSFVEYSTEDGIVVNTFAKSSAMQSKLSGKLFFGGNRGISVLTGSQDTPVPAGNERAEVTDIKINNESVLLRGGGKYDFGTRQLALEHSDYNLEIDFSSLNYTYSNKIRYAYKLDHVDPDWVYAPKGRQFATYNNLGKGNYTFRIKTSGPDNKWHEHITSLSIYKKPVFYESNLAYAVYTLLLIGLAYSVFRFTLYRLRLRSDLRIAQIEKEKTEELTQAKLAYFTNISHDLLTPLTIISCLIDDTEITAKKPLPHYEKMRSNVNRLKRLIQQVLDFRRVESGNMHLKLSTGNICLFIDDICRNHFSPLAKKKHITFTINLNGNGDDACFDADKIDKVIFNVLSNAFKYTPEGGQVKVWVAVADEAGTSFLTVKVSDTGVGIPKEELENIFKPFYNNERTDKETNGIGLSLTHELVQLHHGTITVESEMEKGASFTIRIPVSRNAYSAHELKNAAAIVREEEYNYVTTAEPGAAEEVQASEPSITLLLVEDNIELLTTLQSVLRHSYRVVTASNGKDALKLVHEQEVDIVVSDVMMPEMDGLEFCRTMKNDIETSHIPVILLTAKNNVEDRVECYKAGANGYISKPFELPLLIARINNFLSAKRVKQSGFKSSPELNISTLEHPSLDDEFLKDIVAVTEKHLSESEFDVVALAQELNMSRSTLYRKIRSLIGTSPNDFIKNIRLKHACQMMTKNKSMTISEIAFATGFSDPRYFSTCFKAEFGITPSDYQKK
ncbi:hybrid sensor histidine kinase/response regulator transcription factor [Hufsiella ginkgonis]|uniref:histidine kinase n=1 Tax=Hufsiella ginkgonis TaxID=2695274 RepID=A0A7K1Y101_9SPHI|nr:response regulator [Hufsiella ginkgonis]